VRACARGGELELAELRVLVGRGEQAPRSLITLSELAEDYLELRALVAAGERGERTLERYEHHLRKHVLPALGRVQVQKLTADQLAR
jgi:integrase-like protein